LKSELGTKARQVELGAIPAAPASEGSVVGTPTGNSEVESVQNNHTALDVVISDAIAGITAEAQRVSGYPSSEPGDEIGSALKDLTAIAEKIQKGWSAASIQ
jgi:hypothetical protein